MRTITLWCSVSLLLGGVCFGQQGYFWQLTDLHYDPWYHINQESCNKNLSDLGKYGDFECDAPWDLVYESVKAMMDRGREAEFILWSGDNPPHVKNAGVLNQEVVLEITRNITEVILELFPDKMVLPVLGNHDYYPKDQLPGETNPIYNSYAELWSSWLNTTDMKDDFKKGGYYTRILSHSPKIRAVVLNTNLYLVANTATEGESDPGGQLAWLENVMNSARSNGEKVHVFYHVPVGKVPEGSGTAGWLRPEQNALLKEKLIEFSNIILGMYSAHAHQDTYKIFYDENGQPVSSLFIPPSVTPWKLRLGEETGPPHNPALRRYTFHKSSYELIDVEQYSLNLPKANSILDVEWLLLYTFRQTYGVDNITTPQLQLLLEDMKQFASENFHHYYDMNTVGTELEDDPQKPCDCVCKSTHLCAIEFVDYVEFDRCNEEKAACNKANGIGSFSTLATFGLLLLWKILL